MGTWDQNVGMCPAALCKQGSLASAWMANETITTIILKPLGQRDRPCPYHVFPSSGIMKVVPINRPAWVGNSF